MSRYSWRAYVQYERRKGPNKRLFGEDLSRVSSNMFAESDSQQIVVTFRRLVQAANHHRVVV
jgi:hypothetical protein